MGFLIIYDADATPVRVVRVLHGKRDVASILGS
jgi:plasmid stabilization system protein ParE